MIQADIMPMTTWGPADPEQDRVTIRDWAAYYSIEYTDRYPIAESTLNYLLWRDQLRKLIDSNPQHDNANDSISFRELLCNEDIIWPKTGRKLLIDFLRWEQLANKHPEAEFYRIYQRLRACITSALEKCQAGQYFAMKPEWDKQCGHWTCSNMSNESGCGKSNDDFDCLSNTLYNSLYNDAQEI